MNRREFVRSSLLGGTALGAVSAGPVLGVAPAPRPTHRCSDVRAFGAVGDGRADDTDAIQRAVDEGGGVIVLPWGSYRITRPIVLDLTQGYAGIRGESGTARILMTGPGPAFRIVGHHEGTAQPSTVKPGIWAHERMPIVGSFEIVGQHAGANGIELQQTMQTVIQQVLVRNCRYGIHLVDRNRNFILCGSHIYECTDTGVFFDDVNLHQVNIFGNHISYNRRAGIRQWNGDVHNVQITGNDIEYNAGSDDEASGEIVLEAPEGVASEYTIASNTIQAVPQDRGANVRIIGRPGDPPAGACLIAITGNILGSRVINIDVAHAQRITITGNTIYGGTLLNLRLRRCQDSLIGSNTFVSNPASYKVKIHDGVLLETCVGCLLTGNVMRGCTSGEQESGGCITLRRCRDISICSCQILDPVYRGIGLYDSTRCKVSDNSIVEARGDKIMLTAIDVAGKSSINLVQNNAVSRGTRGTIACDSDTNTVLNNTIWE